MKILFLCPQWGHEHLDAGEFFSKVKEAGYDGVDTWLPENPAERKRFIRLLSEYDLMMVSHQHQASGDNIDEYCKSYEYYLELCLESEPLLINSHTGRDYFSLEDQLRAIDTAADFTARKGIQVAHEIHRGRVGYAPIPTMQLFSNRPGMKITADFSHWVCVTESFLENFRKELDEGILRTEHVHARVGFPEGPQIPDPQSPFWQKEVDFFLGLWDRIIEFQRSGGRDVFTITPEFGPPPYLWTSPADNSPLADQWEINLYMKDLLKTRFSVT